MLRLNLWTFARTCFFPNTMITRAQMAKFSSVNIQVTHHKSDNEFSVIIGNDKAFLEYTEDNKTINVLHVYVPEVFRGKNVAKLLSQSALDYIAGRNKTMIMTCTYFTHYVETIAPEYKKYLHK